MPEEPQLPGLFIPIRIKSKFYNIYKDNIDIKVIQSNHVLFFLNMTNQKQSLLLEDPSTLDLVELQVEANSFDNVLKNKSLAIALSYGLDYLKNKYGNYLETSDIIFTGNDNFKYSFIEDVTNNNIDLTELNPDSDSYNYKGVISYSYNNTFITSKNINFILKNPVYLRLKGKDKIIDIRYFKNKVETYNEDDITDVEVLLNRPSNFYITLPKNLNSITYNVETNVIKYWSSFNDNGIVQKCYNNITIKQFFNSPIYAGYTLKEVNSLVEKEDLVDCNLGTPYTKNFIKYNITKASTIVIPTSENYKDDNVINENTPLFYITTDFIPNFIFSSDYGENLHPLFCFKTEDIYKQACNLYPTIKSTFTYEGK